MPTGVFVYITPLDESTTKVEQIRPVLEDLRKSGVEVIILQLDKQKRQMDPCKDLASDGLVTYRTYMIDEEARSFFSTMLEQLEDMESIREVNNHER